MYNCALTLIPANKKFPNRKVIVGNPGKAVKDVSDEMIEWKTEGTKLYQQLPKQMKEAFKECEPLRTISENRKPQEQIYKSWKGKK